MKRYRLLFRGSRNLYYCIDTQTKKRESLGTDNADGVSAACGVIMKLVETLMADATRPGVEKSYVVFSALIQAIETVKNEYKMERHIEAELRDRKSTDTRMYAVGELRKNSFLAKQVGFKDDLNLKDDEKIPLTKTVGWLPPKDLFNVQWQYREFLQELIRSGAAPVTTEQQTRLDEIEKRYQGEIDLFLPSQ